MHITGFLQVGVRRTGSSVPSPLLVAALLLASAGCDAAEQDVARTASSDPSFEWFEYTGNDVIFADSVAGPGEYQNPILTGFYPDPSIVRAEEDRKSTRLNSSHVAISY